MTNFTFISGRKARDILLTISISNYQTNMAKFSDFFFRVKVRPKAKKAGDSVARLSEILSMQTGIHKSDLICIGLSGNKSTSLILTRLKSNRRTFYVIAFGKLRR